MRDIRHFKETEFECPCCGKNEIKEELVRMLDRAREIAGVPFVINSGFRCWRHHVEIYKNLGLPPLKDSPHLKGWAADIRISGEDSNLRYVILNGLIKAGFKRIGIGKSLIHVDIDPSKVKNLVWVYDY